MSREQFFDLSYLDAPPVAAGEFETFRQFHIHDNCGRVCASHSEHNGFVRFSLAGAGSYYVRRGCNQVFSLPEPGVLKGDVENAFYRTVIPFFLQEFGYSAFHASSSLFPGQGAVAYCGASFSGKSTLVYALSLKGYPYWSDDFFVVNEIKDSKSEILSSRFASAPKLREQSRDYFEQHTSQESVAANLNPVDRPNTTRVLAILFFEAVEESVSSATLIKPVSPEDSFKKLIENSFWLSYCNRMQKVHVLDQYVRIANNVPAYKLYYAKNWAHLDLVVDTIESLFSGQNTL